MRVVCLVALSYSSVFFFQAEDGIRDTSVTGVQTCALPICLPAFLLEDGKPEFALAGVALLGLVERGEAGALQEALDRSEERRVGKQAMMATRSASIS